MLFGIFYLTVVMVEVVVVVFVNIVHFVDVVAVGAAAEYDDMISVVMDYTHLIMPSGVNVKLFAAAAVVVDLNMREAMVRIE